MTGAFDPGLIRASIAPARVRAAIDKLLALERPLPLLDELTVRRFVLIAERSRFAIDVLRSFEEAWEILGSGRYESSAATELRKDLALSLFHAAISDILELVPFPETLVLLSKAAERSISRALGAARTALIPLYGRPDPLSFSVIGLGKLGGSELNFSSDIDLLFLYRADGDTTGGSRGRLSNVEWYTRFAEKIVELLSSRAISPFAWRVDLRLRPEGKSGPLVRSLDATVGYYEREGLAWERQAMIKARHVGGDTELSKEFLTRIEPFIYRRYLDRDAVFQIESIKARIEAQSSPQGRRHVKLSPGGIREIEFLIQVLQLANGGRAEAVRSPSTIAAMNSLVEHHYLMAEDRDELERCYFFLRRLEHRLQMMDARQTHILPETPEEMNDLALRMGYQKSDELWKDYLAATDTVRLFYQRRFRRSKEISITPIEEKVIRVLIEAEGDEERARAMTELGFDPSALSDLFAMSRASLADPKTSALRRVFIASTPAWMPLLTSLPEPTEGLRRFARIIDRYGAKATVYEILKTYPSVTELLVRISSLSTPLSDLLARDPSLLEILLAPGGLDRGTEDPGDTRFRTGARFLIGLDDAQTAGRALSDAAEKIIASANFGVIALGRFGARDLGFGSDLDLVFVSDDPDAAKPVQTTIDRWTRLGLKIDAQLRPMGRTSPIVVSIAALERYLRESAETWERLAWTRARVITGPPELERIVSEFIARPIEDIAEVRRMRERLKNESAGPHDLKRGEGGFIDVEFLEALGRSTDELRENYRFLRTVDAAAQIVTGRPWRGDDLERIEKVLEKQGVVLDELNARRNVIAQTFDRALA